jgi:hypothetical protein
METRWAAWRPSLRNLPMATAGRRSGRRRRGLGGFAIARWFDSRGPGPLRSSPCLRRLILGRISYQVTTCVNGPSCVCLRLRDRTLDRENQRNRKGSDFCFENSTPCKILFSNGVSDFAFFIPKIASCHPFSHSAIGPWVLPIGMIERSRI